MARVERDGRRFAMRSLFPPSAPPLAWTTPDPILRNTRNQLTLVGHESNIFAFGLGCVAIICFIEIFNLLPMYKLLIIEILNLSLGE